MYRLGGLGAALILIVAACATADPSGTASAPTPTPEPTPGVLPAVATPKPTETPPAASAVPGVEYEIEPFDPAAFSDGATIDNAWLPLRPGTQWIHDGQATIDGEVLTRHVILTVTDLTKEIAGIQTLVGYETDFTDGQLTEAELVFWAQDDDGTVWRMGEYPEVYEDGELAETPVWIHGFDDAAAGISMRPQPQPWTPSYAQGWGPAVGWDDRGRVFEVGSETCVPLDCYTDLLIIAEFSRSEPDVYQLKYFAEGTGLVRVGWAGSREEEHEELVLTSLVRLDPAALAAIRNAVLAQEARGITLNDVYALTKPLERIAGS